LASPGRGSTNVQSTLRESDDTDLPVGAHDRLRAAGLRSTPQRQAILSAFRGGAAEHLSADEVFAHASTSLPGLSRGTVYATLAEFSEIGLLAAFGTPEPVRYETNVDQHGHFRCRLCLRVFDVEVSVPDRISFDTQGHEVERIEVRAEGICLGCQEYRAGLEAGVVAIFANGAPESLSERPVTAIELESPLGPLMLVASSAGLVRVAFAEHGDVGALRALVDAEAPVDAEGHLITARQQLEAYFTGEPRSPVCPIDWEAMDLETAALYAPLEVPYGSVRSYHLTAPALGAAGFGEAMGANPVSIFIPCHRVSLGSTPPDVFVGGPERRRWLLQRERPARA
jgi:methylated-DNA-[protein]-cysteine S-methyltransferase